ncbi:myristylated membrane protein-like protein [Dasineura jujubifolia toursvirus 2a]|nr:myristylated membrane protein-like protein [Dasineura jujubifolia toursvirus 2a]
MIEINNKTEEQIHLDPYSHLALTEYRINNTEIPIGTYEVKAEIGYNKTSSQDFRNKVTVTLGNLKITKFTKDYELGQFIKIPNPKWIDLNFLDNWSERQDITVYLTVSQTDGRGYFDIYIWNFRLETRTPNDMTVESCLDVYPDNDSKDDKKKVMYWRTTGEYGNKCRSLISGQSNYKEIYDRSVDNFCKTFKYSEDCKCINRHLYSDYTSKNKNTNDYCWYEPCKSGEYLIKFSDNPCISDICEVNYDISNVGQDVTLKNINTNLHCADYKQESKPVSGSGSGGSGGNGGSSSNPSSSGNKNPTQTLPPTQPSQPTPPAQPTPPTKTQPKPSDNDVISQLVNFVRENMVLVILGVLALMYILFNKR